MEHFSAAGYHKNHNVAIDEEETLSKNPKGATDYKNFTDFNPDVLS